MVVMVLSIAGLALSGAGSITAVRAPFAFVRGEPLRLKAVCPSSITRLSNLRCLFACADVCNQLQRLSRDLSRLT